MKRKAVPNDFWDLTKLDSGTIVYDIIRGPDWAFFRVNSSWDVYDPPVILNTDPELGSTTGSDNSLRLIIMRGPAGWCCYIGVLLDSPLAGLPYSGEMARFECHGGLTFAGAGDGIHRPEGWYYFGWDYAHSGDWTAYIPSDHTPMGDYVEQLPNSIRSIEAGGPATTPPPVSFPASATSLRKWTFGEVKEEIEAGYQQFKFAKISWVTKSKVFPKRFFNRKRLIRVNGAELI